VSDPSGRPGPAGDELVEVVDEDGHVRSIITRAEMRRTRPPPRHRTVFIAVVDGAGDRLLVHRRADWKDIAPGYWDVAFGGVVGAGEGWDEAARRELAEEAGVEAALEALGSGIYDDGVVAELAHVYLARHDGPFTCPDGEVAEVAWVDLADLDGWRVGRKVCPDSVALVLPRLPQPPPPA